MPQQKNIIVAVWMVTYNHENYIAQAIEGVIKQHSTFKFNLFIGEDCSTDNTKKICLEYEQKYPEIIQVISTSVNNIKQNSKNIYDACFSCGAKYIAMCEGDDYWYDEHKLQKQVDFLEANPHYAICFHSVYEMGDNKNLHMSYLNKSNKEESYTIEDLAKDNFIHTPSVVFRNRLFEEFPTWFHLSPVGDYVLHMLNARCGLIKYFPEPMAVYRRHSGSMWSRIDSAARFERWITMLDYLVDENFDDAVKKQLLIQKRKCVEKYLRLIMSEANWQKFLEKLALFSKEDEYISQKWLLEYYPQYIASFTSSRSYRYLKSFRSVVNRIKGK